jgi:hypothetical protein
MPQPEQHAAATPPAPTSSRPRTAHPGGPSNPSRDLRPTLRRLVDAGEILADARRAAPDGGGDPQSLGKGRSQPVILPSTIPIAENIYDGATGRFILIPQGAKLVGTYDSVTTGQQRVLVAWTRIVLPDSSSIDLGRMPAPIRAGSPDGTTG